MSESTDLLGRMAPELSAIRVLRLVVATRGVVLLLVLKFVEEDAVNSHCIRLSDRPLPDARKRRIQFLLRTAPHDLVDERDVLLRREDESELIVGGRKDVVHAVVSAVDDLDVLHAL